ncbi:ATP-binding protein [Chryseolinea sp. T2]|uniref:sensor histidine kinase n=1 Tax=Chryseolinea sp. T2 TaxID=3129255 RepID=UPI0030778AD6
MFRGFGTVFLLLIFISSTAQDYNFKRYRVEEGLPSDIIKASIQDSLGYFWIATDEGLVKYDGIRFTEYRAAVHNHYMKGFLKTRSGRLLAFGDLDVLEIKNQGQNVIFEQVCQVVRDHANDSSLSYPKLLYEDGNGTIWVSESQSVVRLQDKTLRRFEFDLADRTPRFLRAFSFFEDEAKNLFTVSYQGHVFKFDVAKDSFEPVGRQFPRNVEFASVIGGSLVVGVHDGLYTAPLLKNGGFGDLKRRFQAAEVSFITTIRDQKVFVATHGNRHFVYDLATDSYSQIPLAINNVNHVYVSNESDIWISGNDGWVRMKENLFQTVSENINDFIESIAEDIHADKIYYATQSTLYSYDKKTKTNSTIFEMEDGYFQSILVTDEGIWAANAFQVLLLDGAHVKRNFDFSANRRFVTQLRRDRDGNIWLTIPGNHSAYRINPQYKLESFEIPIGSKGVVNGVYVGKDGIYAASNGRDSYLFFKPDNATQFRNISLPISFPVIGDFNVTDMAFLDGNIWLATSEGLLKYSNGSVKKIMLGSKFAEQSVKLVEVYGRNRLLLSNAFGVMLFDPATETHDLFNESSGLPSNAIGHGGLLVARDQQVWVGTSKGLCYGSQMSSGRQETPRPRFIETRINGLPRGIQSGAHVAFRDFISVLVSSITFPEHELTIQYRVQPDTAWLTTQAQLISLPSLDPGGHVLEVKAKKSGPYGWSKVSSLSFTVEQPFWQKLWFFALILLAVSVLVTVSFAFAQAENRRKNIALQKLIDERTIALKQSNEDLIALNQEKNNLIGIVAHDLKSPLNQVQGLISLIKMTGSIDEQSERYINVMMDSTVRLNEMVSKILDVNAIESRQLNLTMERVCISDMVHAIVERYTSDASKKNIKINRDVAQNIFITADKSYTGQVLENILSNAIKFSPHEREVFVSLVGDNGEAICEVRDQGPGLNDDDKSRLFGKYQRLSARPTNNENSTGLGLSIARKFVNEMDGKIWCESVGGRGASFFVSFKRIA